MKFYLLLYNVSRIFRYYILYNMDCMPSRFNFVDNKGYKVLNHAFLSKYRYESYHSTEMVKEVRGLKATRV